MKQFFQLFLFFFVSAVYAQTDLEIAESTVNQTWWYPQTKLEEVLKGSTFKIQLKNPRVWVKNIKKVSSYQYSGEIDLELSNSDPQTENVIRFDSSNVYDYMWIEGSNIYGGFVMRETDTKGFKKFCFANNLTYYKHYIISEDFIKTSKFEGQSKNDSTGFYLLNTRFPGGADAFYKLLGTKIKYPLYAQQRGLEGYDYVEFDLTPAGAIQDIKIIRSIGGNTNETVLKVMNQMPKWSESTVQHEDITLRLPVAFKLQ